MMTRLGQTTGRSRAMRALLGICLALALCAGTPYPAFADEEHSRVAAGSELADARTLGSANMEPVTAKDVKEGTYEVEVDSSSSFFKIEHAEVTVADGQMSATITMRTSSYLLAYLGTGEEAAAAPAEDYIPFEKESMSFAFPLRAFDDNIDLAAFSKSRKKWYDRKILFYANSLPKDALLIELPDYGDDEESVAEGETAPGSKVFKSKPVELDMPDGEYSIEVNMTGGSGRASVSSPTWLIVEDGKAYARLLWSSSYYDYMIVGGTKYLNQTTDGSNSTFKIPITALDDEIDVIADTTAMGDPVEIEYHLTFYSGTIGEKNLIPQEAAIVVLELALVVIVVGGILNYILKKRRKR